jgi:hypothetical protein
VAAVPFPTALLARYLENPTERQTVIATHSGVFALGDLLANLSWLYVDHGDRLLSGMVDETTVRKLT